MLPWNALLRLRAAAELIRWRFLALTVKESQNIRLEVADGFFLSSHVGIDKPAYMEHFADPEIARNLLALPFPFTEADADLWHNRCQQSAGLPRAEESGVRATS